MRGDARYLVHDTVHVSLFLCTENRRSLLFANSSYSIGCGARTMHTPYAFRTLSLACAPRPFYLPFLPQASIEVPLPLVVTGALRGDVLEAFPCVLVAHERVGHAHRVAVAHGAVAAQRYRGKRNEIATKQNKTKQNNTKQHKTKQQSMYNTQ